MQGVTYWFLHKHKVLRHLELKRGPLWQEKKAKFVLSLWSAQKPEKKESPLLVIPPRKTFKSTLNDLKRKSTTLFYVVTLSIEKSNKKRGFLNNTSSLDALQLLTVFLAALKASLFQVIFYPIGNFWTKT